MKGCRPLNRDERRQALRACPSQRERALFALGFATGYRISELLSIRIQDVIDPAGHSLKWLCVKRTKNGEGRTVALNTNAGSSAALLARQLLAGGANRQAALFQGAKSGGYRSLSRVHAWRLLKTIMARAGITGSVSTHSLRKTFAAECYRLLGGAIEKVQVALGHKSITSTAAYLSFRHGEIDEALMAIEI